MFGQLNNIYYFMKNLLEIQSIKVKKKINILLNILLNYYFLIHVNHY